MPSSYYSSCPGGAGEFKVAAVARLYPALAVGQPEIISSSSPFFLVTPASPEQRQISQATTLGSVARWLAGACPPGVAGTYARTLTSPEAWRKTRGCDEREVVCCRTHLLTPSGRRRRCPGCLTLFPHTEMTANGLPAPQSVTS